jgi:hypothetical protein
MRFAILSFAFLLIQSTDSTVLTGIVTIDNEALAGCEVKVLPHGLSQITDADGKFQFVTHDLGKLTLAISYLDRMTCSLVIEDIPSNTGDLDLGTIPLVFNEIVNRADYEKFDSEKKKIYEEIRHYSQLLGYINKTSVDTTVLRTTLWTTRNIKYRYDQSGNNVVINYKDWRK